MKTAFYNVHRFEREYLTNACNGKHELILIEAALDEETVKLSEGCKAICIFVNDKATESILNQLSANGVRYIALRSAGYNHVNIKAALALNIELARVPEYSPYSVAEHAVALMLALNRQLVHAHNRISEHNFSLDGLTGFDMHGKIAGIIGTGKIGSQVARILQGFGCDVLCYDINQSQELIDTGARYVDLKTLCENADIITLHLPLTKSTTHIINQESLNWMKRGVMLINTSRGGLIQTIDVVQSLKTGQLGFFGMDVYEEESGLFFEDHSADILQDDIIARLTTFGNVLITSHQAFLTDTALKNIAETTMFNLDCFEQKKVSGNEIRS